MFCKKTLPRKPGTLRKMNFITWILFYYEVRETFYNIYSGEILLHLFLPLLPSWPTVQSEYYKQNNNYLRLHSNNYCWLWRRIYPQVRAKKLNKSPWKQQNKRQKAKKTKDLKYSGNVWSLNHSDRDFQTILCMGLPLKFQLPLKSSESLSFSDDLGRIEVNSSKCT